jgi:hypothetical protein
VNDPDVVKVYDQSLQVQVHRILDVRDQHHVHHMKLSPTVPCTRFAKRIAIDIEKSASIMIIIWRERKGKER